MTLKCRVVSLTNNDNSAPGSSCDPVHERMSDHELSTGGSVIHISMSDNQAQSNDNSSFEFSVEEQLYNITMTSTLDSDNDISDAIGDLSDMDRLREWALMIPPLAHTRLEQLMDILRQKYPDLPKSPKKFLGTDTFEYEITNFGQNEEFVYFGIKNNLQKMF